MGALGSVARLARETGWRAADYAYAGWRQVAGTLGRDDPHRYEHPEHPVGRPVVLVPGVYEPWAFLQPLASRLAAEGIAVHALPELGTNARPVPECAELLGRVLQERDLRDVVLVAHSKGGLIGKLAMVRHDPDGRVAHMVTVNTPYAGSSLARLFPTRAVRAFLPDDPTIVALAREREVDRRITAVRSVWDPHIPGARELGGAADVVLGTHGHFLPLEDPRVVRLVVAAALAPVEDDDAGPSSGSVVGDAHRP